MRDFNAIIPSGAVKLCESTHYKHSLCKKVFKKAFLVSPFAQK